MQSARNIFRRASRRLRRSSRHVAQVSQQQSTDDQENSPPAMAETAKTPPVAVSADSMEGVSSGLSGSEMVAASFKLTDLDSSTEDVQVTGPAPKDGIDQLLIKQRRELMYELRTIQNSHRSVSKGDQRRRLERFFRQHLHGDVSDTTSESSNEGTASPRRRRRNGVILMELEGLSRQRSVTQRLQSETFRHQLENMVRGTLSRQQNEVEAALRVRSAGLPAHSRQPLVAEGGVAETGSHVSGFSSLSDRPSIPAALSTEQQAAIPVAPPLPAVFGPNAPPQPPPLPPAQPAQPQWQHAQARQLQPTPQRGQQSGSNHLPVAPPSAPWLLQNRQQAQWENRPTPNADVLRQAQREATITEISQLVHRQLVQETLESNFRGTLEYLMTNHLESTDADGGRVMNFIHSIQQSRPHRRNDFSHLGIHVPSPQVDSSGAVGGAAIPAAFMQEMESLRSRMDELHEMVRMSMEMQLDLQRAIRQEVAGALHQQHGTTPSSSPATQPAAEGNCIICLDKEVDAVLYQCGHMCVCLTCGLRLSSMGSHCPMCRAPIRDVIRAYRSQRN